MTAFSYKLIRSSDEKVATKHIKADGLFPFLAAVSESVSELLECDKALADWHIARVATKPDGLFVAGYGGVQVGFDWVDIILLEFDAAGWHTAITLEGVS